MSETLEIKGFILNPAIPFRAKLGFRSGLSMWKDKTLFWIDHLVFLKPTSTITMCSQHLPVGKTKNLSDYGKWPWWAFWNPDFWKAADHHPRDLSLFSGHDICCRRDGQPYLKFYMKKSVLSIFCVIAGVSGFLEYHTVSGLLKMVAVSRVLLSNTRRIQHREHLFLSYYNRYDFHLIPWYSHPVWGIKAALD